MARAMAMPVRAVSPVTITDRVAPDRNAAAATGKQTRGGCAHSGHTTGGSARQWPPLPSIWIGIGMFTRFWSGESTTGRTPWGPRPGAGRGWPRRRRAWARCGIGGPRGG